MKVCLIAINSKYIHTSPAVDSLAAFAAASGVPADSLSFTVNQPAGRILERICGAEADVYCFSVYIWNVEMTLAVIRDLKKIRSAAHIWLGGPEVSFRASSVLKNEPAVCGIMRGEGEETFSELCSKVYGGERPELSELAGIRGITYRDPEGTIRENPSRKELKMDRLVFPYYGTVPDLNRIYYYESSRGCPFGCIYCMSSIDRNVRFKSIEKTEKELEWFLENRIKQVKFVDRTFNVDRKRSMAIWKYLREQDNGITNFHFEICAELLSAEELDLLKTLRPGQVQFEIGVQTSNPQTLEMIRRIRDEEKLRRNVDSLLAGKNIHIHLDLIAGLPQEDIVSFRRSFDLVYGMHPLQLQLGFLKILSGTPMESFALENGYVYSSRPPYEILSNDCMSYEDLCELRSVEEMVEVYHNSCQFEKTLKRLEEKYSGEYYSLFLDLARFYKKTGYDRMDHARMKRYEILLEFIADRGWDKEEFIPLLLYDALARERLKNWPSWAGKRKKPEGFDYDDRDPLTGNAKTTGARQAFLPVPRSVRS